MSRALDLETVTRSLLAAGEAETRRARPHTESIRRFGKRRLAVLVAAPAEEVERPRTYGECLEEGYGDACACPFVGCKHHLYLDVNARNGSIKLNFPDKEPGELADTCALRVAARGNHVRPAVGAALNIDRETVRLTELGAIAKLEGIAAAVFGWDR